MCPKMGKFDEQSYLIRFFISILQQKLWENTQYKIYIKHLQKKNTEF